MMRHIQYPRSLEDSERVRKACLAYVQNWYHNFYHSRPDVVAVLQGPAAQLQGHRSAPLGLQIFLAETSVSDGKPRERLEGTSGVEEFLAQALGRSNVPVRHSRRGVGHDYEYRLKGLR
jgi:hypothetical protein